MPRQISARGIAFVAQNSGFSHTKQVRGVSEVVMATAIALAESGGNADAHNSNRATGDDSWGLWQINMLGAMGENRRRTFGIKSNEELTNPFKNGQAAYKIYQSQGMEAWSVFKSGAYVRYLGQAKRAAANPSLDEALAGIPVEDRYLTGETDTQIANPFAAVEKFINENAFRVGMFITGLLVIFVAVVMYAKESGTASKLANLVPTGKLAKLAKGVR